MVFLHGSHHLWVLLWCASLLSAEINYYLSFSKNKERRIREEQQETGEQHGVLDKMTTEQQIHESLPLLWMCEICEGYIVMLLGLSEADKKCQSKFWNSSTHQSHWLSVLFNQGTISSQQCYCNPGGYKAAFSSVKIYGTTRFCTN